MKKLVICILVLILSTLVFTKIHISYEEFAYKVFKNIIEGDINDKSGNDLRRFISEDKINEFKKIMKDVGYPSIELPEKFNMPFLYDENSYKLLTKEYVMKSGKWIENKSENSGESLRYSLDLRKDNMRSPNVEVKFSVAFEEKTQEDYKMMYGIIDILLEKQRFNKYKIEDISVYNIYDVIE